MNEFARIKTFIKVVEAGSFSAAARDVSSVSSVARQVKALEDELGARLLNRNTRRLALTDAGRRFYNRVTAITHDLEKAKSEIHSMEEEVKGILRASLRITAGTTVVIPALPKFLERYPGLQLDLTLSDERVDLIGNNLDVAMWLGELPDADIVARRLSPTRRIVYGSPAYFERHGVPHTPQDLRDHSCLLYAARSYQNRWGFSKDGHFEEVDVQGTIRSDNGLVLLSAARSGLGVGIAHEWMVRRYLTKKTLVQVMEDYTVNPRPGDADLYAVFPSSRGLSRKVRAFIDFLIETFENESASHPGR
ncbi:LysR family transcriptional regulator [Bordetella genomosp. 4]|uniref:LysR family transcriptional regulator n=1 Tax=Bordetella genomosp. 4 TaxID=463044 RepID=UPI000B9EC509|nr:LysR family transcriptional regulator [Bordetella genomosp. 4]OZI49593.1 LysR family transcriptional regulator [Bordetella genomosp. 4]